MTSSPPKKIDSKAIKVEEAANIATKLRICLDILASVGPVLGNDSCDLDIDEDIVQDFALAESRIKYISDHIRRVQLKLRKVHIHQQKR